VGGTVASSCASTNRDHDSIAWEPDVEAVEQRRQRVLRDDELAVGVADVAGQLLAPPSGVDADDAGAAQRSGTEEEHVLGDVLEQHADVDGTVDPQRLEHLRSRRGRSHDGIPGPRLVLVPQPDVRVAQGSDEQLGDGVHRHSIADTAAPVRLDRTCNRLRLRRRVRGGYRFEPCNYVRR
jgi:hypothetical protein